MKYKTISIILLTILTALLLASCAAAEVASVVTENYAPEFTKSPTITSAPTLTELVKLTQTSTVKTTLTQIPTATHSPSPTPWPTHNRWSKDSKHFINKIELKYQFGLGVISSIDWSPDGNEIAIAVPDGIHFYDPKTLTESRYQPTQSQVTALIYDRTRGKLLTGHQSGAITVWDGEGRIEQIFQDVHSEIQILKISPDGRWLASSNMKQTSLWDLGLGKLNISIPSSSSSTFRPDLEGTLFSPDGMFLSIFYKCGGESRWDIESQRLTIIQEAYCDGFNPYKHSRISTEDGTRIAYLSSYGYVGIKNWGDPEFKPYNIGSDFSEGYAIRLSQDGGRLGVGINDKGLMVFDLRSDELILQLEDIIVNEIAFDPEGKRLIAVTNWGNLVMFDIRTGEVTGTIEGYWGKVMDVSMAPDGKHLFSGYSSGNINCWELPSPDIKYSIQYPGSIKSLRFSPDGKIFTFVISGFQWYENLVDKHILLETNSGKIFAELIHELPTNPSLDITDENGNYQLLLQRDNELYLYDINSKANFWTIEENPGFFSFITPDDYFVLRKKEGLSVHQTSSGVLVSEMIVPYQYQIELDPKGIYGATTFDGEVNVFSLFKPIVKIQLSLDEVDEFTFSSDGEFFITTDADGKIRFFETDTFIQIGFLQYNLGGISDIEVSQSEEGYWMIIGGDNGIVQVWELELFGK